MMDRHRTLWRLRALLLTATVVGPACLGLIGWAQTEATSSTPASSVDQDTVRSLCRQIGDKLTSISIRDCLRADLELTGARSVSGEPVLIRDFPPPTPSPRARVLMVGGIHGDEYSSVSIAFKWLMGLQRRPSDDFHWRIAPLMNPDGLLQQRSQRMNANGVDLNRNFPCPDWFRSTQDYWVRRTSRNQRRYPGPAPLSEPESRWLVDEIFDFNPQVIIAVHAPFSVVDFDGPRQPPDKLGSLYLKLLGTYPGSLGRYAGTHLATPVVTIELPSAGIMPSEKEQRSIWRDLNRWLNEHTNSDGSLDTTEGGP